MGIIRRLTDLQLGSINTTKILSVSTSEILFTISSGNRAVEAFNGSNFNIFYGQSNLAVNSGIMLNSINGAKFWDTVVDNFNLFFRLNTAGVTVQVVLHEYAGNN